MKKTGSQKLKPAYPSRLFFLPVERKKREARNCCNGKCRGVKGISPLQHQRCCPVHRRFVAKAWMERCRKRGIPDDDAFAITCSEPYKTPAMRALRHFMYTHLEKGKCALFLGKKERGKAFACSYLIARRGGVMVSFSDLCHTLKTEKGRNRYYEEVSCLAVTNITERVKEGEFSSGFLSLLQERRQASLPTLLTSSLSLEEITTLNKNLKRTLSRWCYWYQVQQSDTQSHVSFPLVDKESFSY